jgi:hypothetical protein
MSEKTEVKEISKNRAYLLYIGGVEILAMKLEGFKAIQLGAALSPMEVDVGGTKMEASDWLTIVKDKNQITMPYEVWVKQMAQEISKATGSSVNTISVASSGGITLSASAIVRKEEKK